MERVLKIAWVRENLRQSLKNILIDSLKESLKRRKILRDERVRALESALEGAIGGLKS